MPRNQKSKLHLRSTRKSWFRLLLRRAERLLDLLTSPPGHSRLAPQRLSPIRTLLHNSDKLLNPFTSTVSPSFHPDLSRKVLGIVISLLDQSPQLNNLARPLWMLHSTNGHTGMINTIRTSLAGTGLAVNRDRDRGRGGIRPTFPIPTAIMIDLRTEERGLRL